MNSEDLKQFDENGYVWVKNVLDIQQVQALRSVLLEAFERRNTNVLNDGIVYYPQMYEVLKNPKFVDALESLLGKPFVVPPHSSAMHNTFGVFHSDTTGAELEGYNFHKDKNYRMVTAAIYLQDNNEFGGGIWLVPGSHRKPDKYVELTKQKHAMREALKKSPARRLLKRLSGDRLFNWNKPLESDPGQVNIPSKAGDAVIWDMRLYHRASAPKAKGSQYDGGKIGLFFTAGANNDITTNAYMQFVMALPANAHLLKTRQRADVSLPPSTDNFIVL
jgi:ectoine hydroxylase-related dioxygenase (phytanoyl-CoA dioxygenase family)